MKIRLFRACIEPILLYGAETWTLTKTLSKRIDGCYTILLRKALGWSYKDRKTLNEIYGNLKKPSEMLQRRRLEFVGHCLRSHQQAAGQLALWEAPNKRLRQGQGRGHTQIKQIINDLPDYTIDEVKNIAQDREAWRNIVRGRYQDPGYLS